MSGDNVEAQRDALIEMWNQLIGELHVAVGRPGEGLTDEELVAEVVRLRGLLREAWEFPHDGSATGAWGDLNRRIRETLEGS